MVALLGLFTSLGVAAYSNALGDDLGASYIGCRLLAAGQGSHLYSHSSQDFADVGPDDAWEAAAEAGSFEGFQHPYVQTPLWAWILRPLCRSPFAVFQKLFVVLAMLCFAACVWLTSRFWAPTLLNPWGIGIVLIWLWFSQPFQYAMSLTQTHVLFLLLTIASLALAERNRPRTAGLLLACAAAVKVTPGILAVYWLLTRRWKAAASMAGSSILLFFLTLAAGPPLTAAYFANLRRVSRLLLLSANNQSFAAWWMGRFYPVQEAQHFRMLPLPAGVRLSSLALMICCAVIGGLLDRRQSSSQPQEPGRRRAPLGAMVALVGSSVFAPIAWTHYSIVLIAPLMMLGDQALRLRWRSMGMVVFIIAALNVWPFSVDMISGGGTPFSLLRSGFYASLLCLSALAAAGLRDKGAAAKTASSQFPC